MDDSGKIQAISWNKNSTAVMEGDLVKIHGNLTNQKEIKVMNLKKISLTELDAHKLVVELNKQKMNVKEEILLGNV